MGESEIRFIDIGDFTLSNGKKLPNVVVAYQTHGELNREKSNAVLVFHALSGSSHIAGKNRSFAKQNRLWKGDCCTGWWDSFVGRNKIVDTKKHFVICQNILGGCYGTTGPASINQKTGKPFGSAFPDLEIEDMARLQKAVLEKLGIERLGCVIGSSNGGCMAIEFALLFGDIADKVVIIGSAAKTSSLNKLHGFEQLISIENDPNYNRGDYYDNRHPEKGLMLARMIAEKTYIDIETITSRAKKETILPSDYFYDYRFIHNIESYMFHRAKKFVERFDANTYLKIMKASQSFDLAKKYGNGSLTKAFTRLKRNNSKYLVAAISSDVCYYPEEQEEIVRALKNNQLDCRYEKVDSSKGHDSFLIEPAKYLFLKQFLENG